MSSEIGPNGQDLPDINPEWDVDSDLVYTVRSRALTWEGQEMFNPDFGIELYRNDRLVDSRLTTSFRQIPDYLLTQSVITRVGNRLRIQVGFRELNI